MSKAFAPDTVIERVTRHLHAGELMAEVLSQDTFQQIATSTADRGVSMDITCEAISEMLRMQHEREGVSQGTELDSEHLFKVQLALTWDREIKIVPSEVAALYRNQALPKGVNLAAMFGEPRAARFVSIPWTIQHEFCGVWVVPDTTPGTDRPEVRFTFLSATPGTDDLHLHFALDCSWDEAVYESALKVAQASGHLGTDHGHAIFRNYLAAMMHVEGLLAAVYDVLTNVREAPVAKLPSKQGAYL